MDAILTEKIKIRLGITGTFHDTLIDSYADDVKAFMRSGGVPESIIESEESVGCIARGVMDLWNFGSGEGKFSESFFQRLSQLKLEGDE